MLNNIQMPITASPALGEVIMIHSHAVSGVSQEFCLGLSSSEGICRVCLPESQLLSWLELAYEFKGPGGMAETQSVLQQIQQAS